MATLMKAKTANTKAKSVDQLQLAMDYVAKEIAQAVSYGRFSVEVYVRSDFEADVKQALLAAGYSVNAPVWHIIPDTVKYTKRGFFAKFLAWFDRDDSPGDGVFDFPTPAGSLKVDWSLAREAN